MRAFPRLACAALAFAVLAPAAQSQQRTASAPSATTTGPIDTALLAGVQWRSIGPNSSGRSVAVAGSVARPNEYYIGTTGGGVWKTVDGGRTWNPVTDKYFGGTIGAIAVAETNPDIVYVGGGEYAIRGNVSHGDGVWKSTDAGKTWSYMGLGETQQIARVKIHPTNPDIVYVGAAGHVWGPNPERGVFRSRDGGRTWQKVLFRNDSTGITDLVMDPTNPNVLYAAFWQSGRKPWMLVSGGAGSGIFKTTDGGDTWTEITRNPGLPTTVLGNIGIAVSGARPNRIWALIEADSGGLYRSDDAGRTWQFLNGDRNVRQRAWYYTKLFADPKDSNVVHVLNVSPYTSRDGGRTLGRGFGGGDNHDMWIDKNDPRRMAVSHDNGVVITTDGGTTRVSPGLPTAQMYHVHLTNHFPYHVCGAEQDGSAQCGPSRGAAGGRGGGGGGGGGAAPTDGFYGVAGGESGYIASSPVDPDITYGGNYGGDLSMRNRRTGQSMSLDPWPLNPMGHDAKDSKYRFQWTFPIMNSPHEPRTLYAAANVLFKSIDEGRTWRVISPDLTVNDSTTQGASGGPITKDQTSVEYYGTIFAMQESPVTPGLLWTGSDDGLIHVSRNAGATWTNVTPKELPKWTRISIVEPSRHAPGTMYFAANRFQMDDFAPYLYRTTNYGQTWTRINDGIAPTEFTRVIREDPEKRGLLYAGTERGVWMSRNDGRTWQRLQLNLPPVPVHDLAIKDDDLVAATHGRSFWIIDNLEVLRQADAALLDADAHLYKPREAYRGGGYPGAEIQYRLRTTGEPVTLEFLDAAGKSIRKVSSTDRPAGGGGGGGGGGGAAPGAPPAAGMPIPPAMQPRLDSLIAGGLSRDSAMRVIASTVAAAAGGGGGGGGGGRGGGGGARVTSNAGLNSYTWNLRYPDASTFQGIILWAGGTTGPLGAPGTYTVRMTVGNRPAQTQTFVVKKDPRATATNADLVAQHEFLIRVRDQVTRANDAVRTIRNVKFQLDQRRAKLTGAAATLASAFTDSLSAVEGEVYQVRNRSGQDPLNYPIKLNDQIGGLAGFVSGGDRRPPPQAIEVYNTLIPQLDRQLARLKRAMDTQLPRINEALKAAGEAEIVPSTEEVGGGRPGAGQTPGMGEGR